MRESMRSEAETRETERQLRLNCETRDARPGADKKEPRETQTDQRVILIRENRERPRPISGCRVGCGIRRERTERDPDPDQRVKRENRERPRPISG